MTKADTTFNSDVEFTCPCGGRCEAGTVGELKIPMLLHTLPYCSAFERMDVIEFMRYARQRKQN